MTEKPPSIPQMDPNAPPARPPKIADGTHIKKRRIQNIHKKTRNVGVHHHNLAKHALRRFT